MADDRYPDPEVAASMKEAADRAARAKAERDQREAEARGEVNAQKIVDDMDAFDGRPLYRDPVAEIVARVEAEGDES